MPNLNCFTWMITEDQRMSPEAIMVDEARLLRLVWPASSFFR